MCGYLFILSKKNSPINRENFLESSKYIEHRGPDDFSSFYHENIAMCFYRLSIRDLSMKGRQPMLSFTKKNIILFNGEIYNSENLKNRIDQKKLLGNSDTEILVNLFEKYKQNSLDDLKGMFSFVVYDFEKKKCFLARDRFGMKPLYYYNDENYLIVSSEIKPILNFTKKVEFNDSSFGDFFFKGHMDHGENTFFKNIKSLAPAHYKIISKTSEQTKRYWNILEKNKIENSYKKDIPSNLRYLFNRSIKEHLSSDTEIAACLSGGNDSASIVACSNQNVNYNIKTFTYEFEDQLKKKHSEIHIAKKFAKINKLKNFTTIVTPKYVKNNFDKLLLEVESPITSLRLFGIKKLYEEVKKKNIKVMLEGYGGDELLAGYDYQYMHFLLDKHKKNSLKKIFSQKNISHFGIKKLIYFLYTVQFQGNFTSDGSPYLYFDFFNKNFFNDYLLKKSDPNLKKSHKINFLKHSQYIETRYLHIPRALKYVDRLSMVSGVESRVPLLDHELFNFSFHLNNDLKIKNFSHRWIWKKTFKYLKLQKKEKNTITDPQRNWFNTIFREMFEDEINSKLIKESPYFDYKKIQNYYEYYKKQKSENSFGLMQILSSLKFIRTFNKF